jgi:hypothetical protein
MKCNQLLSAKAVALTYEPEMLKHMCRTRFDNPGVMLGRACFSSETLNLLITGWITSVRFLVRVGIIIFATKPRPSMKPNQSPVLWVLASFSPGVKSPERESNHLHPVSRQMCGALPPFPV